MLYDSQHNVILTDKDEKERSRYNARLDFYRSQTSLKKDWQEEREEERKEQQREFEEERKVFQKEIELLKADAAERERLLREKLIKAGIDPVI